MGHQWSGWKMNEKFSPRYFPRNDLSLTQTSCYCRTLHLAPQCKLSQQEIKNSHILRPWPMAEDTAARRKEREKTQYQWVSGWWVCFKIYCSLWWCFYDTTETYPQAPASGVIHKCALVLLRYPRGYLVMQKWTLPVDLCQFFSTRTIRSNYAAVKWYQ